MILDRLTRLIRSPLPERQTDQLAELRTQLLLQRRWSYLRYVHLREGLVAAIADTQEDEKHSAAGASDPAAPQTGIRSFLAVGAGRGLAELALAVEFPEIQFLITDIVSARTPNYQAAEAFAAKWKLANVEFGTLDVAHPIPNRFDFIASTEVVEHIKDDETALANMLAAANHSVYCLVPFADEKTLADPKKQATAWERHEHYRYGYSAERFQALFPDIIEMRGCYWHDRGFQHRTALGELSESEIKAQRVKLAEGAQSDIVSELPKSLKEAQGIWVLARSPHAAQPSAEAKKAGRTHPAQSAKPHSNRLDTQAGRLAEVQKRLVFYRSWSYLRYVHLREGLMAAPGVRSVLSIGCGRGLAELALAIEFPEIEFLITDIAAETTSSAEKAIELGQAWSVANLAFRNLDILSPDLGAEARFDFVCSVEVLEHLEDDRQAAENMRALASRYTFCLVPFADRQTDSEPARRARAWEKDRHYRLGYSDGELRQLFPGRAVVRGCYWQEAAGPIPAKSSGLDDQALLERVDQFKQDAACDVLDRIPKAYPEALGIWILSETER